MGVNAGSGGNGTGRVTRADRIPLPAFGRPPHQTAEGYVFLSGRFSRVGVLDYRDRAGKVTREFVPPDELFKADSLATMGNKPVTIEHPSARLGPDNMGDQVGHTMSKIRPDTAGGFVEVDLSVMKRDGIAYLDGGGVELSTVYDCDIDPTPGVWRNPATGKDERYDAVQRNRRYSELAITKAGRAGPDVRVRVDAAADLINDPPGTVQPFGGSAMDPAARLSLILAALAPLGVRADSSDAEIRAAVDTAKTRADAAPTPAQVQTDRLSFFAQRRRLYDVADRLGVKLDGADGIQNVDQLGNDDLTKAIVLRTDTRCSANEEPAYFRARLDSMAQHADSDRQTGENMANAQRFGDIGRNGGGQRNGNGRTDAADPNDYPLDIVRTDSDRGAMGTATGFVARAADARARRADRASGADRN